MPGSRCFNGIGAVLSQSCHNGEERPIVFVLRALSASEKNYEQIEEEAVALVFVVLYGRKFTLLTGHYPNHNWVLRKEFHLLPLHASNIGLFN